MQSLPNIKPAKIITQDDQMALHLDEMGCYLLDYPGRSFNVLSKFATDNHNIFLAISYGRNDAGDLLTALYRVSVRVRDYKPTLNTGKYTLSLTFHQIFNTLDSLAYKLPKSIYTAATADNCVLNIDAACHLQIQRRFKALEIVEPQPVGSLFKSTRLGMPYYFVTTSKSNVIQQITHDGPGAGRSHIDWDIADCSHIPLNQLKPVSVTGAKFAYKGYVFTCSPDGMLSVHGRQATKLENVRRKFDLKIAVSIMSPSAIAAHASMSAPFASGSWIEELLRFCLSPLFPVLKPMHAQPL